LTDAVLDASVVGRWFWQGDEPGSAALRAEFEAGRLSVTVPPLLFLELLNVAGRQLRWGTAALERFADDLDRTGFDVIDPELNTVARWIGRGLTAYDASYVALAEQTGIPLITADRAILQVAPQFARSPGRD
jgi:predicted nucleic acid-binding protein